jgi:hypothetical protein
MPMLNKSIILKMSWAETTDRGRDNKWPVFDFPSTSYHQHACYLE